MDRTPQHQAERSRRLIPGVALVTAATAVLIATAHASPATHRRVDGLTFPNPSGLIGVLGMGEVDADNPFFRELGTNGRSCVTCHRPAQGWSITPVELRDRFNRTDGLDPIFRPNDGSTCEGADVSTIRKRRQAFSLLLEKGLIRVPLHVPASAEFDILYVDDPHRCGHSLNFASMNSIIPGLVMALSSTLWLRRNMTSSGVAPCLRSVDSRLPHSPLTTTGSDSRPIASTSASRRPRSTIGILSLANL